MAFSLFFLKWTIRLIYVLSTATILYFPLAELFAYFGRETRLFKVPGVFPIEDTLLPLLCLAIVYAVLAWLRRRIEDSSDVE